MINKKTMINNLEKEFIHLYKTDKVLFFAWITTMILASIVIIILMTSCNIKEINPINKVIIGCVCNDGTTPIYRPDILVEKSFLTPSNPCTSNGGIREFIYKN